MIRFENITLSYDNKENIIENLNLTAKVKEIIIAKNIL